ncbi:Polysaccharide biosynthesis protein [compost metagenome]
MQIFTYAAPFLALPYLSRVLGPTGFGLLITTLSLILIANVLTDYGFSLSATYIISRRKSQARYISKVITAIYLIKAALLMLACIATAMYLSITEEHTPLATISILSAIFFQSYTSPWLFQGIEKMKNITYCTVASRSLYVVIIFFVVQHKGDYDKALFCNAISAGVAFLLSNTLMAREGFRLSKPSKRLIKLLFSHSSNFFISRITLQASSSFSVLLLSHTVGTGQVGLFGAAQKIFQALVSLMQPVNQALYPYLANSKNTTIFFRIMAASALLMLPPVIIAYFYSGEILAICFGEPFRAGSEILRAFLITSYVGVLTILMGYPAFAAVKRVDLANKSVIISSLIQAALLIALYTADQANPLMIAYSILATESITLTLRSFWFYNLIAESNSTNFKQIIKGE